MAVRPEAEVGRDLLIIWCVGGGERDTDSYTDTLTGPGEAALSRSLIGQSQHVAALSLARSYQWASAWACAAHWAQCPRSAGAQSHFRGELRPGAVNMRGLR